jgi:hypothetical protein
VVTNSINDKVARNLWKILKETETASHYPFFAEWDNFIEVLCGALGLPLDTIPPDSTAYQCAKAILGTASLLIHTAMGGRARGQILTRRLLSPCHRRGGAGSDVERRREEVPGQLRELWSICRCVWPAQK